MFSLGVFLYVVAVATILNHAESIFGKQGNFWGPVMFLMLFVFSATITSGLVLGYPLWLFLNGNKKDSVWQLGYTIAFLFAIIIIVFVIRAVVSL